MDQIAYSDVTSHSVPPWSYPYVIFSSLPMFKLEDAQEEFGWKLVHGDVFRPPKKGMLLSIMLGCGTQISIMVFFTLGKY